ncbi:hypothetical protein JW711_04400 [Candidatus Woesearchaeota archaeon]|nr:hypothetical protein [Candidatus Woesearchaeota archaeon]
MRGSLARMVEKMGLHKEKEPHDFHVHVKPHHEVFFIWVIIMFIAVIGAHFFLNMGLGDAITGYVTVEENPFDNLTLLLDAMAVLFITILIIGMAYETITHSD